MRFDKWFYKQSGLTQEAFADAVGVTQGRIWQLLHGDRPSLRLGLRIEDATGGEVTIYDFPIEPERTWNWSKREAG
jgi:transcriptional regulator with XRE-family HTH domain